MNTHTQTPKQELDENAILDAMKMLIKSRRGYQETMHYKLF